MSLDSALTNFADAFAAGHKNFGTVAFHPPQPVVEPISLGAILKDYYARLSLNDKAQVSGALHLRLFALDELETVQHGWRWISDNGGPVRDNPDWNPHWIVIADRNGDAITVDDSTSGGTVFGNIGSDQFKIADDLASFFQTMAEAILVEVNTFDYKVDDDDFNPNPAFIDAIRAIALRLLGPVGEAGFVKFFFE